MTSDEEKVLQENAIRVLNIHLEGRGEVPGTYVLYLASNSHPSFQVYQPYQGTEYVVVFHLGEPDSMSQPIAIRPIQDPKVPEVFEEERDSILPTQEERDAYGLEGYIPNIPDSMDLDQLANLDPNLPIEDQVSGEWDYWPGA